MHRPEGALAPGGRGYRAEIDGLRALAVGGVVAHHAGLAALPGGFTGVDVFFVISGYLITGIIAAEMAAGRFSQWRFLERRARRIVPALAAMLAVTGLAAWALLTPEDFKPFAQSLTASALFASNLLYAREVDYFDSEAGLGPLLHTWTLGVEEQFYLVFPLLLIACRRWWRPRAMMAMVLLLGLASFGLAVGAAQVAPLYAFYLLPTRMWEFTIGAAIALLPSAPRTRTVPALAGLALIFGGYMLIVPGTPAPGAMFLLPTLGTALVILFAGPDNAAGRALAWPPLAGLGLVSFGTYLWHQPLLVLARYVWFGELPLGATLALVAASVALGWASYRWLEQPVRQRRLLKSRTALLTVCAIGLAVPVAAGVAGHLRLFLPAGANEAARYGGLRPDPDYPRVIVPEAAPLPFVLYGDSHAMQYHPALTARFGAGALLSEPSCLIAPGISNQPPGEAGDPVCRAMVDRLVALVRRSGARTVVWAQVWNRMLYSDGSDIQLAPDGGEGARRLTEGMQRLADRLPKGTRIILVGNAPTAWAAAPQMNEGWLRCRAYWNTACPTAYRLEDAWRDGLSRAIVIEPVLRDLAARDARFAFVDPAAALCPAGRCRIIQDGKLNHWDSNHLTRAAAARVVGTFDPALFAR
jgi:peptidoglycan/LPS O-acetylase OafA/YrhL